MKVAIYAKISTSVKDQNPVTQLPTIKIGYANLKQLLEVGTKSDDWGKI
jgi:hypothetical protein